MSLIVGIDYDTYKATIVTLPLEGPIGAVTKDVAIFRRPSRSGEDEAIQALRMVRPELHAAFLRLDIALSLEEAVWDQVVWVERGFGMSRRADFILGAFFGAIISACHDFGLKTNPMEAREWKRIVTATAGVGMVKDGTRGNPNVKKEIANEACRGLLALGEIDGADWTPDALDAFGVAFAGRDLNRAALLPS